MIDVHDLGGHIGEFDVAFLRIEPRLTEVIEEIKSAVPSVLVVSGAYKLPSHRFIVSVVFAVERDSRISVEKINLQIHCGDSLIVLPDLSVNRNESQLNCASELAIDNPPGAEHIIRKGPRMEVSLSDKVQIRKMVAQWADATVIFVSDSKDSVVKELEAFDR